MEQELKTLKTLPRILPSLPMVILYHDTYKVVTSPIQSFEGDDREPYCHFGWNL